GSIQPPYVDRVRFQILLVEQHGLAVRREVAGEGPVEPGQVALNALADADHLAASRKLREKHAPVGGDVVEGAVADALERDPRLPRESRRADGRADETRPDLVPGRRPREARF